MGFGRAGLRSSALGDPLDAGGARMGFEGASIVSYRVYS